MLTSGSTHPPSCAGSSVVGGHRPHPSGPEGGVDPAAGPGGGRPHLAVSAASLGAYVTCEEEMPVRLLAGALPRRRTQTHGGTTVPSALPPDAGPRERLDGH